MHSRISVLIFLLVLSRSACVFLSFQSAFSLFSSFYYTKYFLACYLFVLTRSKKFSALLLIYQKYFYTKDNKATKESRSFYIKKIDSF